jgi:hypothetical protein
MSPFRTQDRGYLAKVDPDEFLPARMGTRLFGKHQREKDMLPATEFRRNPRLASQLSLKSEIELLSYVCGSVDACPHLGLLRKLEARIGLQRQALGNEDLRELTVVKTPLVAQGKAEGTVTIIIIIIIISVIIIIIIYKL